MLPFYKYQSTINTVFQCHDIQVTNPFGNKLKQWWRHCICLYTLKWLQSHIDNMSGLFSIILASGIEVVEEHSNKLTHYCYRPVEFPPQLLANEHCCCWKECLEEIGFLWIDIGRCQNTWQKIQTDFFITIIRLVFQWERDSHLSKSSRVSQAIIIPIRSHCGNVPGRSDRFSPMLKTWHQGET